jgi:hypothetical protein
MKTECRKPVFHTGRHTYLILYSARDMPTNDEQEHTTCSTIRRGPSCPLWDSLSEAVAKCRAFLARFKGFTWPGPYDSAIHAALRLPRLPDEDLRFEIMRD